VDAESLERDFQPMQRHVVEQGMLARGVDDDLRREDAPREIAEEVAERRHVVNEQSLLWLIHLTDAVYLQYNHSMYLRQLSQVSQITRSQFVTVKINADWFG